MSYCAMLSGEDLSRYINKIESVGLRKAYLLAPGLRSDLIAAKRFCFLALQRGGQNS